MSSKMLAPHFLQVILQNGFQIIYFVARVWYNNSDL